MTGTAICDLGSMIVHILTRDMILYFFGDLCTPPQSMFWNNIFWILLSIRDDVLRCSTWLSVLMALIRYLISKYFSKSQFQKIQTFKFGIQASLLSFLLSTVFSIGYYLAVKFEQTGIWRPALSCTNILLTMEAPIYEQRVSDLFSVDNAAPLRIFQLVNGSASKMSTNFIFHIIPCILFPVLTTLLAVELKRTERNRSNASVLYRNNTEKTTILVIIMTFLFFIASLPTGIATVFQVAYTDLGYLFLFIYIDTICNALLLSTASITCFICFAMSIQYRKTARKVLHIPEPKLTNTNGTSLWRTTC